MTIAGGTVNLGYNGTPGYTGQNPGVVIFGGGTLAIDLGSPGVNDSITVRDFTLTSDSTLSYTLLNAVANGGSYTILTSTTPGGDMVLTFKRDQDSIDGSTTAVIEVGTTLVSWPTTYPVPDGPVAANPGLSGLQGSPVGFDTVTLVLPRGLDAAKFARLKVTVTP